MNRVGTDTAAGGNMSLCGFSSDATVNCMLFFFLALCVSNMCMVCCVWCSACMYTAVQMDMCMYMCMCMCMCMCVYVRVYVCMCVMCMCVCVHVYVHLFTAGFMHILTKD